MTEVPFYSNTPDDSHCFQAAFKMVLGYFLPKREFTWEELEQMSDKRPGLSTWPQRMLINLTGLNFKVSIVEGLDAPAFIKDGGAYLRRAFGDQTAEWQIRNSDISAEQATYQEALDKGVDIQKRIPLITDISAELQSGALVICTVNSKQLNNKPGYVGHAVVVYNIEDDLIWLHDPGLPARQSRQVSHENFEAAWASPNDDARNYISVKLKDA